MATIFPQFWLNNILKDLDHCSPVLQAEMSDKTACRGFIMGRQLGLSPISLQSTHNVLLKCCTVVTFLPALSTVRSRYIAYQFKGFSLFLVIPKPSHLLRILHSLKAHHVLQIVPFSPLLREGEEAQLDPAATYLGEQR